MSAERFVSWESTCRIQRVLQHDNSGCGVACLAMVAALGHLLAVDGSDDFAVDANRQVRGA